MRRSPGRLAALGIGGALILLGGCREPASQNSGPELRARDAAPSTQASGKEVVVPAEQGLPFSLAVRAGEILFLAGQIGNRPGTLEVVEGGIQAETRQAMENIRAIVEEAGGSMEDIVKCTVFLDEIEEWDAMNEVYREFFPSDPPVRSALGADGLALDASVEIECIAAAP